jgi:protein gp37
VSPSKIEWTGETWNPTTGCDKVSEGCRSCYALTLAGRLKRMGQAKYQRDGDPRTSGPGFGLTLHPDALDIPLRRKKPTTWFVDSMSDLFHPMVPDEFICDVFTTMGRAGQHTFQVLTKRPQRMADLVGRICWHDVKYPLGWWVEPADMSMASAYLCGDEGEEPLPNVWLGTSIENDRYIWRADHLRQTPAAVRFLSLEPLLGPVPSLNLDGIHWVITGGESGPNARPIEADWVRDIRDRCQEAGVAFFHKQWGGWTPKAGGRELDGRTWDEMPEHAGAVA